MAGMNFLKKAKYWFVVFLCILSIGNVSVSLGYQPAYNISSGNVQIVGLEAKDFLKRQHAGLLLVRTEKNECLVPVHATLPTPLNISTEVIASWYGQVHHNKLTASGQKFNMHKNTLAHKTLPLGTRVRLVNLDNGRYAEGVINDRGPYITGRDVDVSYAMARQLGFVRKGVVKLDMKTIWGAGDVYQGY